MQLLSSCSVLRNVKTRKRGQTCHQVWRADGVRLSVEHRLEQVVDTFTGEDKLV
jgi:hypothetical protein